MFILFSRSENKDSDFGINKRNKKNKQRMKKKPIKNKILVKTEKKEGENNVRQVGRG